MNETVLVPHFMQVEDCFRDVVDYEVDLGVREPIPPVPPLGDFILEGPIRHLKQHIENGLGRAVAFLDRRPKLVHLHHEGRRVIDFVLNELQDGCSIVFVVRIQPLMDVALSGVDVLEFQKVLVLCPLFYDLIILVAELFSD